MTATQKQAIWELCRQGLHDAAARAEQSWENGGRFEAEPQLPLTREIAVLIDCANWESRTDAARRRAARVADLPAQPFLTAA